MPESPGPAQRQVVFLASIDWDSPWQRHQAFASVFAQNGHEVFFVENYGFRSLRLSDSGRLVKRIKNIFSRRESAAKVRVVAPAVLPPTNRMSRGLNRYLFVPRLAKKLRAAGLREGATIFAYLPTPTTLKIIQTLSPGLVIYDCVDYFQGHPDWHQDFEASEAALLKRADCVLTTSRFLYDLMTPRHPKVYELHHGVTDDFLRQIANGRARPSYRRFCYFGTLWSAIDYGPIKALAEAGFEVTLIGPVKESLPALPSSVRVAGPVPVEELPRALSQFDGFLLPYANSPYNQGVVPAKTYECLASGKPVLCSPLANFSGLKNVFYLARTPQEWVGIARDLERTESAEKRSERITLARGHSTQIQFSRLRSILAELESGK